MDRIPAGRTLRHSPIYHFRVALPEFDSFYYLAGKICQAFEITMSQLFAECEGDAVTLTSEQMELLNRWSRLDERQQAAIYQLLDVM